jgi:hypothetical protein
MNTTQEYTNNDLPSSEDYKPGGSHPWRIAKGKLRQGREADGTEEVRDSIAGRLKGVYVKSGVNETTGKAYEYVVARLETSDLGEIVVHCPTKSKSSAGTFMEGLCQVVAGAIIAIEPNLGKPKTINGETYTPTYANVKCYTGGRWSQLRGDGYRPMEEWLEEFKNHPSTIEWKSDGDEGHQEGTDPFADTPTENWNRFAEYICNRQWPAVEIYTDAWSAVLKKLGVEHKDGEIDPENFNKLVGLLDQMENVPASVQKAVGSKPVKAPVATLDPDDL